MLIFLKKFFTFSPRNIIGGLCIIVALYFAWDYFSKEIKISNLNQEIIELNQKNINLESKIQHQKNIEDEILKRKEKIDQIKNNIENKEKELNNNLKKYSRKLETEFEFSDDYINSLFKHNLNCIEGNEKCEN